MGLLQKAVETYDCHEREYAGKYIQDHTVLAPVSHIVTRGNLEVTLDEDGHFCAAMMMDKDAPKIIIPATEQSAGRTSNVFAHPLCDQLSYLSPIYPDKYANYVENLTKWFLSEFTHPKLEPVLTYVRKGTLLEDLERCGLIQLNRDGFPENKNLFVCWRVLGKGEPDACWMDQTLFQSFIEYYRSLKGEQNVCMITGRQTRCAQQHPKGIVAFNSMAKLISANDDVGFTYRGRFSEDWQAATIGYEASQKAHNALRWLAAEQGSRAVFGGRTFLCWNPQGYGVPKATSPFKKEKSTEISIHASDYQKELKRTLSGFKNELPETADVVIAAFDAATSGRVSLTYYNELMGSDFLQRLYEWDRCCCWPFYQFGIQAPALWQIVNCAYGTEQKVKNRVELKTDDRVMRQQMQRLISCRLDRAMMPADLMKRLAERASSPLAYEKNNRELILTTACAVIRKHRHDRMKEDWDMTLEPDRKDRSYQFGRLLAVLEKVERDTYDSDTAREPNAVRQQSIFCQRPLYAAANIQKQLERAYFPRLKSGSRAYYRNLISSIMENINEFPQEQWNKPLGETYLMGYYLQRSALYTKKNNETEEHNHENSAE